MLFLTKRHTGRAGQRSSKETCFSILGLLLAISLIGGIAALIYGLVVGNLSATITGAIVFGVGVFLTVLFILLVVFCLKETTATSSSGNQQQRQRRHRPEMSRVSSTQVITDLSHVPPPSYPHNVYPNLGDPIHGNFGQHPVQSPTKTPAFSALNQSHSSATSHHSRDNRFD